MQLTIIPGFMGNPNDFFFLEKKLERLFSIRYLLIDSYQDIDTWIKSIQLSKGIYLGYSMGGRILAYLMERFPNVIEFAIFLSTHPGHLSQEEKKSAKKQEEKWIDFLQKNCIEKFLSQWYSMPLFQQMRLCMKNRTHQTKEEIIAQLQNWGKSAFDHHLNRLDCKRTSYFFGEWDAVYRKLSQKVTMPSFMIPQSSHQVHIDNPQDCYQQIQQYLGV